MEDGRDPINLNHLILTCFICMILIVIIALIVEHPQVFYQVLYQVVNVLYLIIKECLKPKEPVPPTGSKVSLSKAGLYAFTNKGTLLRTNDRTIYWSNNWKHAEEVFINMTEGINKSEIDVIWIKNSPCSSCADKLIQHFAQESEKPTVYIGKIWRGAYGDAYRNKEGLRKMAANGFQLLAWEYYKNKEGGETRGYLKSIYKFYING